VIAYKPLAQDDPKVRKPDITRARTLLGMGAEGVARRLGLDEGLIAYFRRGEGGAAGLLVRSILWPRARCSEDPDAR
jgi:hypothetical protein